MLYGKLGLVCLLLYQLVPAVSQKTHKAWIGTLSGPGSAKAAFGASLMAKGKQSAQNLSPGVCGSVLVGQRGDECK